VVHVKAARQSDKAVDSKNSPITNSTFEQKRLLSNGALEELFRIVKSYGLAARLPAFREWLAFLVSNCLAIEMSKTSERYAGKLVIIEGASSPTDTNRQILNIAYAQLTTTGKSLPKGNANMLSI